MVSRLLPLRIRDAVVIKRGKTILGPINLELTDARTTMIIGPNGSGKTTLLRLMHGLERARSGSVDWNCDRQEALKKQALVFQSPIMLRRKVRDNIAYPLRLRGVSKGDALQKSDQWLERVGLLDAANLEAAYLSGGEKQKLALARALVCSPDVLFLDEPTANLDGTSIKEIEYIINDAKNEGAKVIMTTHDMGQARRLAEEILFLYRGGLHERKSSDDFFAAPDTREARLFVDGEIVE